MRTPAALPAFHPQTVLRRGKRSTVEVEDSQFTDPSGEKLPFTRLTFKEL